MTDVRVPEPDTAVDNGTGLVPREPEKITLPPQMVADLLQCAIRSQEGNAVWRGFVAAHGYPSWVVNGTWRLAVAEAALLPAPKAEGERP